MRIEVKSLAPLAAVLMMLLWAPVSGANSDALNSTSEESTSVFESAYGSAPGEDSSPAGRIPASAQTSHGFSETLQSLSPLPVLALGILGLFWVRKHTAEL